MNAEIDRMYDNILLKLGVDAVFMPQLGNTVTLKVLFNQSMQPEIDGVAFSSGVIRTIEAKISDIGQSPTRGDVFVIESVEYVIDAISDDNGHIIKCIVGIDGGQG